MSITQETANLVDTLATAASKIGSTPASKSINELIVSLLPGNPLQADLDALQVSSDIYQANLELARSQLTGLSLLVNEALLPEATIEQIAASLASMRELLDAALAPV